VRLALVRDVDAPVGAAGELPDDPGVDVAEDHVSGLCLLPDSVDVLQDPLDLRAREVGRDRKPCLRPEAVLASVRDQLVADRVGAGVLPDDRVVDGPPVGAVPDHGRLTLVGHTDRGDVRRLDLVEPRANDLLGALPDLHRVVLDPARLRVDLLVLLLIDRDNLPAVVEDHEAGAGCALVYCCCVLSHSSSLHSDVTPPAPARPRFRPRPREAGEMRWLPDPGAPRSARRGSSLGPSSQRAGPCPACPSRRLQPTV